MSLSLYARQLFFDDLKPKYFPAAILILQEAPMSHFRNLFVDRIWQASTTLVEAPISCFKQTLYLFLLTSLLQRLQRSSTALTYWAVQRFSISNCLIIVIVGKCVKTTVKTISQQVLILQIEDNSESGSYLDITQAMLHSKH